MTGKKSTYNKNEIIEVAQKNIDTLLQALVKIINKNIWL